jgi:8-oxo-dGTP pyrophosphatase MutT (NUDIX family)
LEARRIRPIAICVIRNGDRILAGEGEDAVKGQAFYRPLGGAIEFGETSSDTIRRELMEEIGADVANLRYLGTIENIFTFLGETGHEIVQVYTGDLTDRSLYERDWIEGREETIDGFIPFRAVWVSLADCRAGGPPLYPEGLLELLAGQGG